MVRKDHAHALEDLFEVFCFVGIIGCTVMMPGHRDDGRLVMAHRKAGPPNNIFDQVGWPAAEDFVRPRLHYEINIVDVRIQLHPIRDWLLHAAIDAGDGGGKFVSVHVLMILSDSGRDS
jgi:hypothetical protein